MKILYNDNIDHTIEQLEAMVRRVEDLSPVMRGRADAFESMAQREVFAKGQTPWGKDWEELSDFTKEHRRNKDESRIVPLQDTGRLKATVTARATKDGMFFGSADVDKKSMTHQFGAHIPVTAKMRGFFLGHFHTRLDENRTHIDVPARPFLPVTEDKQFSADRGPIKVWYDRMQERVKKYVEDGEL